MDLKKTRQLYKTSEKPSKFIIDYNVITTDFNYKGHIARANGIFKINKPIKFKFFQ